MLKVRRVSHGSILCNVLEWQGVATRRLRERRRLAQCYDDLNIAKEGSKSS
jgi:hypothetical protein